MSIPLVIVANSIEEKRARQLFKNYPIKIVGEGFYQALTNLRAISKKRPLINFGFVGSNDFKIGEIIEIGVSKLLETNFPLKAKAFKLSSSGVVCYTGNSFVISDETKDKKSVFDMELYYIIALGYNVIKSIKIVSDNLNSKEYRKFK